MSFDHIPAAMRERPQWVVWRLERKPKRPKPAKVPYNARTKRNASVSKPADYADFETALRTYQSGGFHGLGYCFTAAEDDFTGIDIDGCIDDEGKLHPDAAAVVRILDTYTEVSQSGTGLHLIVKGKMPGGLKQNRRQGSLFEIYEQGRYFAITGNVYPLDTPPKEIASCIDLLPAALQIMFPSKPEPATTPPPVDASPTVELDDMTLIECARSASNGKRFEDLYFNGIGGTEDHSSLDLALCNDLAFWAKGDAQQMDRLFRRSALMREKWDEMHGSQTYGEMTIAKAISGTRNRYGDRVQKNAPTSAEANTDRGQIGTIIDSITHSDADSKADPEILELAERYEPRFKVHNGGLCEVIIDKQGKSSLKPLCDIAPVIISETQKDDGLSRRLFFEVEAISRRGILAAAEVSAEEFDSLRWMVRSWGSIANVQPGQSIRDKVRRGIQSTGSRAMKKVVYTHLGWRKIGDKLSYLHSGGAIGAKNVIVETDDGLRRYCLNEADEEETKAALSLSIQLLSLFPFPYTVPLIAMTYLAPLCYFCGSDYPDFILYLRGTTGAGKSTLAAAALSHYGDFPNGKSAPASFNDTTNSLRRKAFLAKDALLWLDDYKPATDALSRRRMDQTAQDIIRAYADGHVRGRVNTQGEARREEPARGLCIITGEQLPDVSESGIGRLWTIDINRNDCPHTDETRSFLEQTPRLSAAGAAYIRWLAAQADVLPKRIKDRFRQLRKEFSALPFSHSRHPSSAAWLMLGMEFAVEFWLDAKSLSGIEERDFLLSEARASLCERISVQREEVEHEKPTHLFLNALKELEETRDVVFEPTEPPYSLTALERDFPLIGYKDESFIYLIPKVAYSAVSSLFRKSGREFPLGERQLWKQLSEAGMILPGSDGTTRKQTKIMVGGKPSQNRYVWLKRQVWDDPSAALQSNEPPQVGGTISA